MTTHIEAKKREIAKTVIMPGDPLRAKFIAENYLKDYKLVNSVRGMYAYTGYYNNKRVTVMGSGMGIASMAIYSYELFKFYDVESIIRVGSCGAFTKDLNLYDVILVEDSYSKTSYDELQSGRNKDIIASSKILNKKIIDYATNNSIDLIRGRVYSSDVFYGNNDFKKLYKDYNCLAVEMETYALFYNAKYLKKNAAAVLTVSDNLVTKLETTPNERETKFTEMIELVLNAVL